MYNITTKNLFIITSIIITTIEISIPIIIRASNIETYRYVKYD